MKKIHIKNKLELMGVTIEAISLGDFDRIGEYTAKRERDPSSEHYNSTGAFYRANYERGVLVYYLIKQFKLTSLLEVGFGRGYVSLCAAKAFYDLGIDGKIVSIEPNMNEQFANALMNVFPKEWFKYLNVAKGTSKDVLPNINETFDLVYIDGDHSYEGTKFDWENTKDKFSKFLLFDDYHLPTKNDPGIQCRTLIDQIDHLSENCSEPELITLDRRMFMDDRGVSDSELDYGQVLFTKKSVEMPEW